VKDKSNAHLLYKGESTKASQGEQRRAYRYHYAESEALQ